jgi:hypothetical protein
LHQGASPGEALLVAARKSVLLICGVMLFLLIAAFIEAYWSSMTAPSPLIKYLVGAALWMLIAAYLLFAGRTAMRLSDASVVIRPRPTWEAMDLGVLLSQRIGAC